MVSKLFGVMVAVPLESIRAAIKKMTTTITWAIPISTTAVSAQNRPWETRFPKILKIVVPKRNMINSTRSPVGFLAPLLCTPEGCPLVGFPRLLRTRRPVRRLQIVYTILRSSSINSRCREPSRVLLRYLKGHLSRGISMIFGSEFSLFSYFTMYWYDLAFTKTFPAYL